MTHVPQIPHSDNPYELAMHAHNVRYYEQNIKVEALHAAGTALCVEGFVALGIILLAAFLVLQ